MDCRYCQSICKKKGFQKNGKQKYQCKICFKYQQEKYCYNALAPDINSQIKRLIKRGAGIRDISFITEVSSTTVIKKIRYIAAGIQVPCHFPFHHDYEIDEIQTYVWNNNKAQETQFIVVCFNEKSLLKAVGRSL